jgi:hypothetical protein
MALPLSYQILLFAVTTVFDDQLQSANRQCVWLLIVISNTSPLRSWEGKPTRIRLSPKKLTFFVTVKVSLFAVAILETRRSDRSHYFSASPVSFQTAVATNDNMSLNQGQDDVDGTVRGNRMLHEWVG